MKDNPGRQNEIWTHGDDYEIIFTAHEDYREKILERSQEISCQLTRIGQCEFGQGVTFHANGHAVEFEAAGYNHFQA